MIENDIVTPVIYKQQEIHGYGVHRVTGEVYSNKRGGWRLMKPAMPRGKSSNYPKINLMQDGVKRYMRMHVLVHETLNPELPVPPGVEQSDWEITPQSVKAILRDIWQVHHIDHDTFNYAPANLEWVTEQQNSEKYQEHRSKQIT